MSLELHDITKNHGANTVLDSLSVTFEPASLSLVHGPSGAGKTTLLRVATLLEAIDKGQVILDGRAFSHKSLFRRSTWSENEDFRQRVSIVFQQLYMWPHVSMGDCLSATWRESPIGSSLNDLISVLGLDGLELRLPKELSLGQLQRFAFLRAIGTGADFYFFDEVTSALDSASKARTLEVIQEMVNCGKGVIFVSHDPTLLKGSYDQLIEFGGAGGPVNVRSAREVQPS